MSAEIDAALGDFDFRRVVGVVRDLVDATNRRVDETTPWKLERGSTELASALGELVAQARLIGELLAPFLPDTSARVAAALTPDDSGRLPDRSRSCGCSSRRLDRAYAILTLRADRASALRGSGRNRRRSRQ